MSRVTEVLNDLELAAKKLGMTIEDAVAILLGKHKTHAVVQTHVEVGNGVPAQTTPVAEPSSSPSPSATPEAQPNAASAETPTPPTGTDTPQPEQQVGPGNGAMV